MKLLITIFTVINIFSANATSITNFNLQKETITIDINNIQEIRFEDGSIIDSFDLQELIKKQTKSKPFKPLMREAGDGGGSG